MKKIIIVLLLVVCNMQFIGCDYCDLESNSLEDYIVNISSSDCGGNSSTGIDSPQRLLPGVTFFDEYDYIEGGYHWHEDDMLRGLFTTNVRPEVAIVYLKYDENVYYDAKQTMLERIKPYNDKLYEYDDYIFYINPNQYLPDGSTLRFPQGPFTMACYNDTNCTLIFIGFYSETLTRPSCLDEKYLEDIEGNWKSFIDQYYGEYYDFSSNTEDKTLP